MINGIPLNIEEANKIADEAALNLKREIDNTKWKVIKERLKALKKLSLLKDLDKKRFKKIMLVHEGNKEVVYIDDGTYSGMRLVTFIKPEKHEIKDFKLLYPLKYF